MAEICGEPVCRLILAGRIKGTSKSYIEELARQEEAAIRRWVAQAQVDGRWPPLDDAAAAPNDIWLRFPIGRPVLQAKEILRRLGPSETAQLRAALDTVLPPRVDGVNGSQTTATS